MSGQGMSQKMIVISLVNGMIGGVVLVLPLIAIKSGYIMIALITLVEGLFNYYSCMLCIRHLRNYSDLDEALLKHFGGKRTVLVIYNLMIVFSTLILLILYFALICDQWISMIEESVLVPILNALFLFPLVYVMKKFKFGVYLLAYGVLSVIGYCLFLVWMLATAPSGSNQMIAADTDGSELLAMLNLGFAIQGAFIPIMKNNSNKKGYNKLLVITFMIGSFVYGFIGYAGGYGILNRTPLRPPETIEDYFPHKEWEVIILEVIYLIHLYTVFPQFLLIAKQKFFNIFSWPNPVGVSWKEIIFVGFFILVSFVLRLLKIKPQILIDLNGSIIGFFFIYLIPIGLHIKCMYFGGVKEYADLTEEKDQKEMKEIGLSSQKSEKKEGECCDIKYQSKYHKWCEMSFLAVMTGVGIYTMVYTLMHIK